MNSPCMYCNDRSETCHSECSKYKEYQVKHKKQKAAEKASRSVWRAFNGYQIMSIRNNTKGNTKRSVKRGCKNVG